jgi:hypothetical protein
MQTQTPPKRLYPRGTLFVRQGYRGEVWEYCQVADHELIDGRWRYVYMHKGVGCHFGYMRRAAYRGPGARLARPEEIAAWPGTGRGEN